MDQAVQIETESQKCTFGVTFGKLLGYMVSERGIEADPDKIEAILDIPALRIERERLEAFWVDFSTSANLLLD